MGFVMVMLYSNAWNCCCDDKNTAAGGCQSAQPVAFSPDAGVWPPFVLIVCTTPASDALLLAVPRDSRPSSKDVGGNATAYFIS